MRHLNEAILKSLYFSKTQSISEISKSIEKSIPLTTKLVNGLLKDSLILESGLGTSTGGRKAMKHQLNPQYHGYIVSVAIDQHFVRITAFDISNQPVCPVDVVPLDLENDQEGYNVIEALIKQTVERLSIEKILAIGISMPGFVDSTLGVNSSYPPGSLLYALRANIESCIGVQTYIENDSSVIAIAEQKFGLAKNSDDALIVNLNWGVGLGMIIQGELFRGHSGFAGEFSHIPLANEKRLCSCGKNGCLEVEASLLCALEYITNGLENGEKSYLEKTYRHSQLLKLEDVYEAYQNGDQLTVKAIMKIAYMLGKGIATLIHILNPEKVIVSGRGARFGDSLLPPIQSSIQEFCIPRLAKQVKIQISNIKDVQLLGSACIAVSHLNWENKNNN